MKLPTNLEILSFIRRKYGQILLWLILLVVIGISLKWGYYLLHNDNYSPELNPLLSILRYLESPTWRSYRTLGFASDSEQADIFRSVFFFVLQPILPDWILGQIFYFICLFVGSWFTGLFVSQLVKETKLKKYYQFAFLTSGIMYISTLWTMWLYYQNMAPYISNFGFFPLLIWSIYKYLKDPEIKKAVLLVLSSILFTSTCVISTIFIVDFVFILAFTIFVVFSLKKDIKESLNRISKTIGLFLLTQLFWILPFIHYTVSTSQDVIDSYINKTITSSTIDLESEMQNALNSARLYNRNLFETDEDEYLFPMSEEFQTYDFYKVIGVLPVFFSILALIFGILKKNKKLLFWGIIALGSWFLIKVINPPFGTFFVWMQENISFFKQVFRWPFSKLGQIYLVSISVLSTFGIINLISFLSSFIHKRNLKKIFLISLSTVIFLLPIAYSEYLFRGYIFPNRALVSLPQDYYKLKEYLEEKDLDGRIYYAPPANNNYFREYEWGFWGSQFISYIIPNPMMDMSSAVGSAAGEKALLEMNNVLRAGDKEKFNELIQRYDIEYVLYDESLNTDGFSFPIDTGKTMSLLGGYTLLWESDILKLYQVPRTESVKYVESVSSSYDPKENIFVREVARNPLLSPSDMKLKNMRIENGEITGDFEYTGNSTYISSNLESSQLSSLPSKLVLKNGQVSVTPSYPYLTNDNSVVPYKRFGGELFDHYTVADQVFSSDNLQEGVSITDTFSSVNNIFGVKDSDFQSINLIPRFLESKGSDCSGGFAVDNTSVRGQEVSSGFNLKGASELPCAYTKIHSLNVSNNYILKVKLNWETEEGNYPGYCIYSETQKKCLNNDKFFDTQGSFGEKELVIDTVVSGSERISLILYTMNTNKDFSSETTFREVTLKYAPVTRALSMIDKSEIWKQEDIFLDGGNKYTIHIPMLFGSSSYIYQSEDKKNLLWQPNRPDSGDTLFEISGSNGIYQRTQNDYIDLTVNLLTTKPNTKYMLFWQGENISNIPADICLIYDKEEKCWVTEMFTRDILSSDMKFFESDSQTKLLNLILGSSSYKLLTENRLDDLTVMEYPSVWENIKYIQSSTKKYEEVEMDRTFNSPVSTYYKLKIDKNWIKGKNILATIPQASSSGWVAVGKRGVVFDILDKSTKVRLNDWKQGWDISNSSYDSISVIYWPNLLSYIGYLIILGEVSFLSYKFIMSKRNAKR